MVRMMRQPVPSLCRIRDAQEDEYAGYDVLKRPKVLAEASRNGGNHREGLITQGRAHGGRGTH